MVVLDVMVDVDTGLLPVGDLKTLHRQGAQRWLVERLEERATAAFELAKRPVVETLEQIGDRDVEVVEAEEGSVAQARNDPSLDHEDCVLDLGFVAWLPRSGRNYRDAVVSAELGVGGVDLRVEAVGSLDRRAQLVGHRDLGHTFIELEGTGRRRAEVGDLLRARDLGVGVVAGAEDRDEQLDLDTLARLAVDVG